MIPTTTSTCLNCGAELRGRFCSHCGQRDTPPCPTFREMAAEAWQELTVFDARLARTAALLMARPGFLSLEFLAGRQGRYVRPLRLYLIASVAYFLLAAMIPPLVRSRTTVVAPGREEVKIDLFEPTPLSPEEREKALRSIERAPRRLKPVFERLILDPGGMRRKTLEALPKVLFALVPVFAAISALFFRRPFSQHLILALHLHAAIFVALSVRRFGNLTGSPAVVAMLEAMAMVYIAAYALLAFRTVYAESWTRVVGKAAGIAVLYLVAGLVAMAAVVAWATAGA